MAVVFQNQLNYRELLMAELEVLKTRETSKPYKIHINAYSHNNLQHLGLTVTESEQVNTGRSKTQP